MTDDVFPDTTDDVFPRLTDATFLDDVAERL
ncbi:hypothetical protein GA0115260_119151, partial [Streptomyces sp. MnatMP-M27]